MRYSTDPLSKRHHLDHEGGPYRNVRFGLHQTATVFAGKDKEWNAHLTRCNALTLREIIWDGKLESEDKKLIRKPMFFFGDSIDGAMMTSLMVITNDSVRLATGASSYLTWSAWSRYSIYSRCLFRDRWTETWSSCSRGYLLEKSPIVVQFLPKVVEISSDYFQA